MPEEKKRRKRRGITDENKDSRRGTECQERGEDEGRKERKRREREQYCSSQAHLGDEV